MEKTSKTPKMKKYKIRDGVPAKICIGGKHLSYKKGQEIPEIEAKLYGDTLIEAKKPDGVPEGRIYTPEQIDHMKKKEARQKKLDEAKKKEDEKDAKKTAARKAQAKSKK